MKNGIKQKEKMLMEGKKTSRENRGKRVLNKSKKAEKKILKYLSNFSL